MSKTKLTWNEYSSKQQKEWRKKRTVVNVDKELYAQFKEQCDKDCIDPVKFLERTMKTLIQEQLAKPEYEEITFPVCGGEPVTVPVKKKNSAKAKKTLEELAKSQSDISNNKD